MWSQFIPTDFNWRLLSFPVFSLMKIRGVIGLKMCRLCRKFLFFFQNWEIFSKATLTIYIFFLSCIFMWKFLWKVLLPLLTKHDVILTKHVDVLQREWIIPQSFQSGIWMPRWWHVSVLCVSFHFLNSEWRSVLVGQLLQLFLHCYLFLLQTIS